MQGPNQDHQVRTCAGEEDSPHCTRATSIIRVGNCED